MYTSSVATTEKGKHRVFLTPTQEANRRALLEHLGLEEEDAVPADRDSRRSITPHFTPEEHAFFDYIAKACGFRGPGPLLLMLGRAAIRGGLPMPKVAVPKVPGPSKKKRARKKRG